MAVADAAYLAGIIDGEGTIGVYAYEHRAPAVHLSVANTDRALLEWIATSTGVGAVITRKVVNVDLHRQSYTWQCSSQAAGTTLRQVQPYLRVKASQAQLALDLLDGLVVPARKADSTWQMEIVDQVRQLNRRGPLSG